MLAEPHAQNVLAAVEIDSDYHIGCLIDDMSFLFYLKMDRVQKDGGVNILERARLPLAYQEHNLVRNA